MYIQTVLSFKTSKKKSQELNDFHFFNATPAKCINLEALLAYN